MNKVNRRIILFLISTILIVGGIYIYQRSQENKEGNCDEIVAEFMERSKVDPLNEITAPVAECMKTENYN